MDSVAPQLKKYRPQTSQTTGVFVYLWKPILTAQESSKKIGTQNIVFRTVGGLIG